MMLSFTEKICFLILVIVCLSFAFQRFRNIIKFVQLGSETDRHDKIVLRLIWALKEVILQKSIFKDRPLISFFHLFLIFGFSFFLLVNVNDIFTGYVVNWSAIGNPHPIAKLFNVVSDVLSVLVLIGMSFFLIRRFIVKSAVFSFNHNVLLHPKVEKGVIKRDSLIVGIFILLHISSRWMGSVLTLADLGQIDSSLPSASFVAPLFFGWSDLDVGIHVAWWMAMGTMVVFIPYFPFSKHIHLMIAPINLAFKSEEPSGQLEPIINPLKPGVTKITDLRWPQLLDSYACIMCNRCQDVCPAYESGAPLSPSALEINKRYYINEHIKTLVTGCDPLDLLDYALHQEAVWSCTTCRACVNICPVGSEPLSDIIELRRRLVFDSNIPSELPILLRNVEQQGNSFNESIRGRTKWTASLDFEVKDATQERVKYLWYVGDYASFHPYCQRTTRKVATVLQATGVDFGILGIKEKTTGNDIRRIGEEGLFESLAEQNIEAINRCNFDEIITTDPHSYNTLKNEYPKLGRKFQVVHYSSLLVELINSGQIILKRKLHRTATYHDPCYLGRYNGIYDDPRAVIQLCGIDLVEMPRNKEKSFCCGAGGGRIWMLDYENITQRPSENRITEAVAKGVSYFTVACPKDMVMFTDAVKTIGNEGKIEITDIIDYVFEAMDII